MSSLDLIGSSPKFRALLEVVERVAPVDAAVLIQGETGTGKEVIARAIHESSPRRQNRFVPLNCAAIPAGLLESELFGHDRGAFTGAVATRLGRFQLADRGTLLLDKIGELPPGVTTQVVASASGPDAGKTRKHAHRPRRCTDCGGHQPGFGTDGKGAKVSARPLLSIERVPDHPSPAARQGGGHPGVGRVFRAKVLTRDGEEHRFDPIRSDGYLEMA